MAKKRIQKIPKRVTLKCPFCDKNNRIDVPEQGTIHSLECRHCKQLIKTPMTQCCIICAFTKTKCPYNLKVEANAKGLQLR